MSHTEDELPSLSDLMPSVLNGSPGGSREDGPENSVPNICAICREDLGNPFTTTPCGHCFHFLCLLRWCDSVRLSAGGPTCPLCNNQFLQDEEHSDAEPGAAGPGPEPAGTGAAVPGLVNQVMNAVNQAMGGGDDEDEDMSQQILESILHTSVENGNMQRAKEVLDQDPSLMYSRSGDGDTVLHVATYAGHTSIIDMLLHEYQFDKNAMNFQQMSPLTVACEMRSVPLATKFLDHGAFVDVRTLAGRTPLMQVAEKNVQPLCTLLLARGAFIDSFDVIGDTALHLASRNKSMECVRVLLEGGAETDQANAVGDTPLHEAVRRGFYTITRLLCDAGADVNQTNKRGESPYSESTLNVRLRNLVTRYR